MLFFNIILKNCFVVAVVQNISQLLFHIQTQTVFCKFLVMSPYFHLLPQTTKNMLPTFWCVRINTQTAKPILMQYISLNDIMTINLKNKTKTIFK